MLIQVQRAAVEIEKRARGQSPRAAKQHRSFVQMQVAACGGCEGVRASQAQGSRAQLGHLSAGTEDVVGDSEIVAPRKDQRSTGLDRNRARAQRADGTLIADLQRATENRRVGVGIGARQDGRARTGSDKRIGTGDIPREPQGRAARRARVHTARQDDRRGHGVSAAHGRDADT